MWVRRKPLTPQEHRKWHCNLLLCRFDFVSDHAALVQDLLQLPRVRLQQQLRLHVLVRFAPMPSEHL
jgi:hypothetical protein